MIGDPFWVNWGETLRSEVHPCVELRGFVERALDTIEHLLGERRLDHAELLMQGQCVACSREQRGLLGSRADGVFGGDARERSLAAGQRAGERCIVLLRRRQWANLELEVREERRQSVTG
jgi:hypothetical protein